MKKVVSVFIVIVVVLLIGSVFADAGAPEIKPYLVEVTNPAGAYAYEGRMVNDKFEMIMKDKINFGEKLVVVYDSIVNDEPYINVYRLNESGEIGDDIYNGDRYVGYVQARDISGVKEGLSLEDFNISDQPKELTVLNSNGVKIYEWPAYGYTEIGIIPYKKIVQGYGSSTNEGWYYINNNGVHGFVRSLGGDLGWKNDSNESIMTMYKNVELTDINGNRIGELPRNTIIKDYYNVDYRVWKKFVIYNGKGGFVNYDDIAFSVSSSEWLKERKNYIVKYDGAVLIGTDNSITDIPKGEVLECSYYQDRNHYPSNWGFTTYEGKKGWVYCVDMYSMYDDTEKDQEYFNEEVKQGLEEIQKAVELVKQYPVEDSGDELLVVSGDLLSGDESGDIIIENSLSNNLTSSQIILICVVCALIASATTAVVIILINKKKNK